MTLPDSYIIKQVSYPGWKTMINFLSIGKSLIFLFSHKYKKQQLIHMDENDFLFSYSSRWILATQQMHNIDPSCTVCRIRTSII